MSSAANEKAREDILSGLRITTVRWSSADAVADHVIAGARDLTGLGTTADRDARQRGHCECTCLRRGEQSRKTTAMMTSLALRIPNRTAVANVVAATGSITVERGDARGYLLAPSVLEPGAVYPLVVVLHGAGRQDELLARAYAREADARGALFFVLRSLQPTWDLIAGGDGEDLDFLGWALGWIDDRYPTDPSRRALIGYSDGASYALAVGLSNPRAFAAVMGWAAGFLAIDAHNLTPDDPRPRVLLEHGTQDQLFPFERVAVPLRDALVRLGYDVTFRVDEGGIHWPSPEFQTAALDWFFRERP
jgi:predicted esterase